MNDTFNSVNEREEPLRDASPTRLASTTQSPFAAQLNQVDRRYSSKHSFSHYSTYSKRNPANDKQSRQAMRYLEKISLAKTFLLAVDPCSQTPFRVNIGSYQAQSLVSKEGLLKIQSKIKRNQYILRELLTIDNYDQAFKWQFELNEAVDHYRRSMVPFYLLEHEAIIYPRYVDYSDLSKNLCDDYKTNIKLYLSPDIREELIQFNALHPAGSKGAPLASMILSQESPLPKKRANQEMYEELRNVSLLHTASKLIKMATKKIYEKLPKQIKENKNQPKIRILKFKNEEAYLYGDEQLIYFQEIREHLRQNKDIELVLKNIDNKDENPNFPPLSNFEYEKTALVIASVNKHQREVLTSDQEGVQGNPLSQKNSVRRTSDRMKHLTYKKSEEFQSLNSKTEDDFIAEKFQKSSIFFWYQPKEMAESKEEVGSHFYSFCDNLNSKTSSLKALKRGCTPRVFSQTAGLKDKKTDVIYSGKVYTPLRVKILNLYNLSNKLQDFTGVKNQALDIHRIRYRDQDFGEVLPERDFFLQKCRLVSTVTRPDSHNTPQQQLRIHSCFLNHSSNYQALSKTREAVYTLETEKEKRVVKPFVFTPFLVQVQAALFLGGKRISDYSYTEPTYFNSNLNLNCDLKFYRTDATLYNEVDSKKRRLIQEKRLDQIMIKDLPNNVRLCLTVIVIPKEINKYVKLPVREGYVFGSVSLPLFDQERMMRQGYKELLLWPFQKLDDRKVCQGECYQYEIQSDIAFSYQTRMNMQIELPVFHKPVFWKLCASPKDFSQERAKTLKPKDFPAEEESKLKEETKKLQQVKKMIHAYPLERRLPEYDGKLLFQYRNYIDILPAFVKSIDFTNHNEIAICYDYLENSEQAKAMQAQEALALLDAQFGDERVRLFAVQKLSFLNDSFISLYMPQLVQALKYEPQHRSALSEFLLERSLKNTRVVGHAFFWSLKANLSSIQSHERFFLILERFLMCCGKFKNSLFRQNEVNRSLIDVYGKVLTDYSNNKGNFVKKEGEKRMLAKLREKELQMKIKFSLILTHETYDDLALDRGDSFENLDLIQMNIQSPPQLEGNQATSYQFDVKQIDTYIKQASADLLQDYIAEVPHGELYYNNQLVDYQQEVFFFPFEPKKPIKRFDSGSTFFMSKQLPLLIIAELAGTENMESYPEMGGSPKLREPVQKIKIMFKFGDDLRQDNLVLQYFKLMDKLWLQNNLDLEMLAYNVMETGFRVGFIEFVDNSVIIADIHKQRGHIKGPFDKTCIYNYFKTDILPSIEPEDLPKYHNTFIKSLAGQCVATYVLGIRDRHTGNFMLEKPTGRFFHIDFGHFLGHSKKKFGIKRDREPFIYSPELHYYLTHLQTLYKDEEAADEGRNQKMGLKTPLSEDPIKGSQVQFNRQYSKDTPSKAQTGCLAMLIKARKDIQLEEIGRHKFDYFEDQCCRAFKVLRQNAHIFINLLMLMVVGGIKQLDEDTVKYLIDSLFLNKSDEEASSDFKKLIQVALNTKFRKFDNVFHNFNDYLKERKKKKVESKSKKSKPEIKEVEAWAQ